MVYDTYTLGQDTLLRYTKNTVSLASVIGDKELYMYLPRAYYHVLLTYMQGCIHCMGGNFTPKLSNFPPQKRSMVTDCNIKEILVSSSSQVTYRYLKNRKFLGDISLDPLPKIYFRICSKFNLSLHLNTDTKPCPPPPPPHKYFVGRTLTYRI